MKVEALKSWGHVKKGDIFEVDEDVAQRWAHKSRVRIVKEPIVVKEPTPKPKGPSRTKAPKRTKAIKKVNPGWYEVRINGELILKDDGEPKRFRKDEAEAL